MNYIEKTKDLIIELNSIDSPIEPKGHFSLRVREYSNHNYPSELQLSLMFIKKKFTISPVEVISHTFALYSNVEIENCYYYFYKDLFRYIVFCRSDNNDSFEDFRGQPIKLQSISEWITRG